MSEAASEKKPRELIWITGIILGVTTISFGVTGYSFPWDQVGYWASKIVTSVPEALDNLIPAIGKISVRPFRDGFGVRVKLPCKGLPFAG